MPPAPAPVAPSQVGGGKIVLGVLGALVVLILLIKCSVGSGPSTTASTDADATAATSDAAATAAQAAADAAVAAADAAASGTSTTPSPSATPPEPVSAWSYDSDAEGMSGKSVRTASVTSSNTVSLGFPYAGEQHGRIALRKHPRWGNDVIFSIEQGQILCHSYGDCRVGVRFDDGKIQHVTGNPPEDGSSETVFLPMYGTFLKQLKTAKKLRIEVQIYDNGSNVFEFDVAGFDAAKLDGK